MISYTALNKYKLVGTLDAQNLVTKVETKVANPVLGDTDLVATYSDYKDFNGVKFPTKILIAQGGFPIWDLAISNVTPNAPLDLAVLSTRRQRQRFHPRKRPVRKLADGVWHVAGGSHHSVVVEFKDYIAVAEAPLDEARSQAVLAEAKKLVPNKPVKYLLTTHHHFDHTGGSANVRGRRRHHRHAPDQRSVFREDADGSSDLDSATCRPRLRNNPC